MGTTVKKHEIDMLHGSIWNKLPLFALPVAATAILEQLFHASDVAIVGNFTGDARTVAVAAVGANGPIIGLIVNLFIGIALGANVVIANAIGCRDDNAVKRAVHTAIVIRCAACAAVALLGRHRPPLLSILNVPRTCSRMRFCIKIYLLGMPVILLYNFGRDLSAASPRVPLAALAISGVLNVLLNLFFVIVLHMTVNGVAIATVAANAVSAALLYVRLTRTDKCVRVERKALRIDGASLKRILSIGLPAGVQSAVFSFANIVIQSAINTLGTVAIAASSAAFNVEILAYDVLNSFSQACTTFVGQNYGAGQIKRCKKTMQLSFLEGAIATFVSVVVLLLSARSLLAIFNSDPEVIAIGYIRLATILPAYVFCLICKPSPVSARWHFARARTFDDARRVRYPHRVGQVRLPDEHDVPDRHGSGHPSARRDGDADPLRRADLPPVQTLCGQPGKRGQVRGGPSLVKMLPEGAHGGLVRAAAHIVAHRVVRAGHDEQLAGRGAGVAVFKRHFERDEVVVLAVDQ